jgi:uncharacterized protein (DUF1501 family)
MHRRSSPPSVRRLESIIGGLPRRDFLRSTGIAAGAATPSVSFAPQASTKGAGDAKALIYVFLRGGIDGLSLVVPINNGADAQIYRNKRNATRMTIDDGTATRRPLALHSAFGMHPAATGFKQLWDEDSLAIVLVEQHAKVALSVTESAMVLNRGRISHYGPGAELLADPQRLASLVVAQ